VSTLTGPPGLADELAEEFRDDVAHLVYTAMWREEHRAALVRVVALLTDVSQALAKPKESAAPPQQSPSDADGGNGGGGSSTSDMGDPAQGHSQIHSDGFSGRGSRIFHAVLLRTCRPAACDELRAAIRDGNPYLIREPDLSTVYTEMLGKTDEIVDAAFGLTKHDLGRDILYPAIRREMEAEDPPAGLFDVPPAAARLPPGVLEADSDGESGASAERFPSVAERRRRHRHRPHLHRGDQQDASSPGQRSHYHAEISKSG
jgi:hypothetical protein